MKSSGRDLRKRRLYLAAPLFSEAERLYNRRIRETLAPFFEVFLPQESGLLLTELLADGMPVQEATARVFTVDLVAIDQSDVLLIVLDGRTVDEGAAFELGVAFSKGKPCVALQTDSRRLVKDLNNPMLSGAVGETFDSLNELAKWASEWEPEQYISRNNEDARSQ